MLSLNNYVDENINNESRNGDFQNEILSAHRNMILIVQKVRVPWFRKILEVYRRIKVSMVKI